MALRRYFGKISPLAIGNLVGHNGELVIDEATDKIYIMDGITPGGHEIANTYIGNFTFTNVNPSYNNTFNLGNKNKVWANAFIGNINTSTINFDGYQQIYNYNTPASYAIGISANITNDINGFFVQEGASASAQIYTAGAIDLYTNTSGTTSNWNFGTTGILTLPNSNYIESVNTNLHFGSGDDVVIRSNAADQTGGLRSWTFGKYGNLTVPGNISISGNIVPTGNALYSLGTIDHQWKSLYVSNNTIYIGGTPIQVANGSLIVNGNVVSGGGSTYSNSNVAAYLPTNSTITAINANITAANSAITTLTSNASSQASDIITLYSNAATQASNLATLTTNAATQSNLITTINANVSAANSAIATLQTQVYSNTNAAAYLTTYSGNITASNMVLSGNLTVNGSTTTVNANSLIINDNIIYVANNNPSYSLDIGFAGHFTAGIYQHTGLVRQASSNVWKLFSNVVAEPSSVIDFTSAVYDSLQTGTLISPTITDIYSNLGILAANAGVQANSLSALNNSVITLSGTVATIQAGSGFATTQQLNAANSSITTLNANLNAANINITTLQSNASSQASDILILYSNAASQASNLASLISNAASQASDITTLYSNAATQATTLNTLVSNAATQESEIALLNANVAAANGAIVTANSAVTAYATSLNSTMTANIVSTNSRVTVLEGNVVSINNTLVGLVGGAFTYGNANVATYLPTYSGNLTAGNVTASGNVSATYYTGNGYYLTGLPATYGNTQVAAYLVANPQSGTYSNTNVSSYLTGNVTIGNIALGVMRFNGSEQNITTTNGSGISFGSRLNINGSAASIGLYVAGNISAGAATATFGNVITTNGLFWSNGVAYSSGGGSYGNTQVAAYLPTFNGTVSAAYLTSPGGTDLTILPSTATGTRSYGHFVPQFSNTYNLGSSTLYWQNAWIGNITVSTGINWANGVSALGGGSSYGNTQVAAYLPTYSGISAASRSQVTTGIDFMYGGFPYMGWQLVGSDTLKLRVNIASSDYTNDVLAIDRQTRVISLYSTLNSNATANVGNVITTSGVFWANGVAYSSGGSTYSNSNVAGYLPTATTITANLGNVITSGGVYWANGVSALGTSSYGNTQVAAYLPTYTGNVNAGNINVTANVNAANINVTNNLTYGNVSTTGNVTAGYFITTGTGGNISGANYVNATNFVATANASAAYVNATTGVYSAQYYWSNGTVFSSGGSGTPSGGNTMIQFNDAGAFGGATYIQYNKTSGNLVSNSTTTSTSTTTGALVIGGGMGVGGAIYSGGNIVVGSGANLLVGSGQGGFLFRTLVGGTSAAIYNLNVVPSAQNYSIATNGASLNINAPTGGGIYSSINNSIITTVQSGTGSSSAATGQSLVVASGGLGVTGDSYISGNFGASGNMLAANYLYTNSQPYAGTYSNSNVASYLPTYTGNVGAGNLIGTSSNVTITSGANVWTFDNTGNLSLPNLSATYILAANTNGNININTVGTGSVNVSGNLTIGGINAGYAPNRPAFRVYGSNSYQWVGGNTIVAGSVDYNQGSYYNAITGIFTAPIAGLYHAYATLRVGTNNGMNQASIQKNSSNSGANVISFWETDTNTGTATHFSMTGYAKLVAGDTIRLQAIAGNINIDANDSWGVTYIG